MRPCENTTRRLVKVSSNPSRHLLPARGPRFENRLLCANYSSNWILASTPLNIPIDNALIETGTRRCCILEVESKFIGTFL